MEQHGIRTGIVAMLICGSASAYTIRDCDVTGYGTYPTGEVFSGTFSEILGAEAISWTHNAPGFTFQTNTTDADVVCRQNGSDVGVVESFGTATVNGEPLYSYVLQVEDRRDPPVTGSVTLAADATTDGSVTFSGGEYSTIPASVSVTAGDSTGADVSLLLDDVTCTYDLTDGSFALAYCSDPTLAAGDLRLASTVTLQVDGGTCPPVKGVGHEEHGSGNGYGHVNHPDDNCVPLAVEALINTILPAYGLPDLYTLTVDDALGNPVYLFNSDVIDGDIDITFH